MFNNGYREVTLLGQNVNAYNFIDKKLSDLIGWNCIQRRNFGILYANDVTEDLIKAHKNCKKLMPILHLPVQSGSIKILKEMNRKHTREFYLKLIDKLKTSNPLIKFSSDFIIGYPEENDNDFKDNNFFDERN